MANPNWVKGCKGPNPNGRPKRPEIEELRKALEEIKKQKGISFIKSYITRSYKSTPMAIALLKKLVPDLTEADLGENARQVIMEIVDFAKIKK